MRMTFPCPCAHGRYDLRKKTPLGAATSAAFFFVNAFQSPFFHFAHRGRLTQTPCIVIMCVHTYFFAMGDNTYQLFVKLILSMGNKHVDYILGNKMYVWEGQLYRCEFSHRINICSFCSDMKVSFDLVKPSESCSRIFVSGIHIFCICSSKKMKFSYW